MVKLVPTPLHSQNKFGLSKSSPFDTHDNKENIYDGTHIGFVQTNRLNAYQPPQNIYSNYQTY